MCPYTAREITILQEIRRCLAGKGKHAPVYMSAGEFDQWRISHEKFYLHRGYLSVWNGLEVPAGYDEIVVQKKRTWGEAKPYLVFRDARTFHEYWRNAHLLGVESFALLEGKFSNKIKWIAEQYHVPESAYDSLQAELEKFMGLNFYLNVSTQSVPDSQLYGSLFQYLKRALQEKAVAVFGKYGVMIDIDTAEWDAALSLEDSPESICVSGMASEEDRVNPERLLAKIIDLMDRLESKKDARYDLKDNLLSQVIRTDHATDQFISCFYSSLKARRSVWRPVAFTFQILYAHEEGTKYLKNPAFIQACGNTLIGEMMESQVYAYKGNRVSESAQSNMLSLWNRVLEDDIRNVALLQCAGDAEQIGKALSKELRTEEARGALARALLVSVLDKSEAYNFIDRRGEDYHE